MPQAKSFDAPFGYFVPTGQCTAREGCSREGWNMTAGLCVEHFRIAYVERAQQHVDEMWAIIETIEHHSIWTGQLRSREGLGLPSSGSNSTRPLLVLAGRSPSPRRNEEEIL